MAGRGSVATLARSDNRLIILAQSVSSVPSGEGRSPRDKLAIRPRLIVSLMNTRAGRFHPSPRLVRSQQDNRRVRWNCPHQRLRAILKPFSVHLKHSMLCKSLDGLGSELTFFVATIVCQKRMVLWPSHHAQKERRMKERTNDKKNRKKRKQNKLNKGTEWVG